MNTTYEWHVRFSVTATEGARISCRMGTATAYAETEAEARQIIADEIPGADVDEITRGEALED